MKGLLFILLVFVAIACHQGQGQGISTYNDFEEKVLSLYFKQDSSQQKTQQHTIKTAIGEIRKSGLDFDTKFELWYYLNQFSLGENLEVLSNPKEVVRLNLPTFISTETQKSLLKTNALVYFQTTYLDPIINKGGGEAQYARLDEASLLLRELLLYQFRPGEAIAEVGAGDGGFSLLLQLMYSNKSHFINEIDSQKLLNIQHQLQILPANSHLPQLILGSEVSSGLEEKELDGIILRNTLHHFARTDEMMESIRASLNRKGKLFVFEELSDPMNTLHLCNESMSYEEILTFLDMEGFELLQRHNIGADWRVLLILEQSK